jgi:hypothetical protein
VRSAEEVKRRKDMIFCTDMGYEWADQIQSLPSEGRINKNGCNLKYN